MNELYDDDRIPIAFETFAESYNRVYDRPAVLDLCGQVSGARVLDIGCGPGLYASALAGRGAQVYGMDVSMPMLVRMRSRLPGCRLIRATAVSALPVADATFDLVLCASVVNYVPDLPRLAREIRRIVRPDGAVVVATRHPMTDHTRKGGSYFDVSLESDEFTVEGLGSWTESYWRFPLSWLCTAFTDAQFHIERIVEPLPGDEMARLAPDHHAFLMTRPTFVALRLVPPSGTGRPATGARD